MINDVDEAKSESWSTRELEYLENDAPMWEMAIEFVTGHIRIKPNPITKKIVLRNKGEYESFRDGLIAFARHFGWEE